MDMTPLSVGQRLTAELLSRTEYSVYNTGATRALHYAEAGAAFNAIRLARLAGDAATLKRLADRYDAAKLPENTANHVDANVCGILPLELYLALGDERLLAQGLAFADGQWAESRPDGLSAQTRFWIDDVWMIGMLQVQAWRATGEMVYLEKAALTAEAYLARLQRPNGLFFHGDAAPHFWGRGNGWVAAGLVEILSVLPGSHPRFPFLRNGFLKMAASLVALQTKGGLWRQLLDRPDAWEETSASAMFGFAFALGVDAGFLPGQPYADAFGRAWLGLTDRLDADGRLGEVCSGTWQQPDAAFYLDRPRIRGDLHGQAAMLAFAWSLSR